MGSSLVRLFEPLKDREYWAIIRVPSNSRGNDRSLGRSSTRAFIELQKI